MKKEIRRDEGGPKMISPLSRNPFRDAREKRRQENAIIIAIIILSLTFLAIIIGEVYISNSWSVKT